MTRGGLNTSALLRMPTIEEKDSECDVKEEVEKKEKAYLKKIDQLETEIERLKQDKQKRDSQLEKMNTKASAEVLLAMREQQIRAEEALLAQAEEDVQEKQLRNSIIEEILKLRSDPQSTKGLDREEIQYQLTHVQS